MRSALHYDVFALQVLLLFAVAMFVIEWLRVSAFTHHPHHPPTRPRR